MIRRLWCWLTLHQGVTMFAPIRERWTYDYGDGPVCIRCGASLR